MTYVVDNKPENPFETASTPIHACWQLGYHDGLMAVPPATGEAAVEIFALDARARDLEAPRSEVATCRSEAATAREKADRIQAVREALLKHLIPTLGRLELSWTAYVVPVFFFVFAFIALIGELGLSQATIKESLSVEMPNFAEQSAPYSVFGLVLLVCIMSVSIKLFFDVWYGKPAQNKALTFFTAATMFFCLANIVSFAFLREKVSITKARQESYAAQKHMASADTATSRRAYDDAATESGSWAGTTFKVTAIAAPLFAAACIIVALSSIRQLKLHSDSVSRLNATEAENERLSLDVQVHAALLDAAESRLAALTALFADTGAYMANAKNSYRHGVETGKRMLSEFEASLPIFNRVRGRVDTQFMAGWGNA